MAKSDPGTVTVIGAGLTGCFLAILLARRGCKVRVYERLLKEELEGAASNRSYNLTFYSYGANALKKIGAWEAAKPMIIPLAGTKTWVSRQRRGGPITSHYGGSMPCYAVPRARLLEVLARQAASQPGVTFHYGTSLVSINRQEKTMLLQDMNSGQTYTAAGEVILGTDGINSQVRIALQQGQDSAHVQELAAWSYKQIYFPPELVRRMGLLEPVMYAWTDSEAVCTAFPNGDGSITAMLMLPRSTGTRFADLVSENEITRLVSERLPRLLPAIPEIVEGVQSNPEGFLSTIYTRPWHYKGFLAILGDAAHGFLPFYGQGMSAGFADCLELSRLLDAHGPDWETIFPLYEQERKRHTDILADLSKSVFSLYRRRSRANYGAVYDRLTSILHRLEPTVFRAPLFHYIAKDPARAADHFSRYLREKERNRWFGLPLAVSGIMVAAAVWELIQLMAGNARDAA